MACKRSTSFTVEEDVALCHAYLEISQDSIVGNNQSGEAFWDKVQAEYEKTDAARSHPRRQGRSLPNRMSTMMTACAKFRGCLNQIYNLNPSGASEQDIIRQAKELLTQDPKYKNGFKYDHVWDLLKDMEKFANTQSSRGRTKSSRSASMYSASSFQDESSPTADMNTNTEEFLSQRPIGVKKAKNNKQNEEGLKKLLDQNERFLKAMSKNQAISERKVEAKIMRVDPSLITDPVRRAYYEKEQARIMRRRESGTQDAGHGESSGSQYQDEGEDDGVPETQVYPEEHGPYMNLLCGDNTYF